MNKYKIVKEYRPILRGTAYWVYKRVFFIRWEPIDFRRSKESAEDLALVLEGLEE